MEVRTGSLRTTLVATLLAIMVGGAVLISLVVLRVTEQLAVQEKARAAQSLLDVGLAHLAGDYDVSRSATNPANQARLDRFVETLRRSPEVRRVDVLDGSMRVVASSEPGRGQGRGLVDPVLAHVLQSATATQAMARTPGGERILHAYAPLELGGHPPVAAKISLRMGALGSQLDRAQSLILIYLLLNAVVLLAVGSFLLDRWLIRPLRRLTEATELVAGGELHHFVDIERNDELGRLSRTFNRMVSRLSASRDELDARIEELERVNLELERAGDTMIRAEKLASVGTLAAGVAHEVGNPLAAILGYVEMLQSSELTDDDQDVLARIHQQVLRIHDIIRDLLDYSRPAADAEPIASVASTIESTVSLVRPQPRLRDIEIVTDVEDGLPAAAIAEARLQQVLLNLALNAADSMPSGGTLTISAHRGETGVVVTVADEGEGIPSDSLPRIFDPFFTTKEPGSGTGLGLAMVERILQDHDGSIEATSEPGRWTRMTVTLPICVFDDDE